MDVMVKVFIGVAALLLFGAIVAAILQRAAVRALTARRATLAAAANRERATAEPIAPVTVSPQVATGLGTRMGTRVATRVEMSHPRPTSFDADDLAAFKVKPEMAETPCSICLEPFDDADVTAGQCLHMFHTTCIASWLAKDAARSCPVCRNSFLGEDLQTIDNASGVATIGTAPPQTNRIGLSGASPSPMLRAHMHMHTHFYPRQMSHHRRVRLHSHHSLSHSHAHFYSVVPQVHMRQTHFSHVFTPPPPLAPPPPVVAPAVAAAAPASRQRAIDSV